MIKDCDEDIKVIEDFSHCTFSRKLIHNPKSNIYVSSIRKSIGVCDGAVIDVYKRQGHLHPLRQVHECMLASSMGYKASFRYRSKVQVLLLSLIHI